MTDEVSTFLILKSECCTSERESQGYMLLVKLSFATFRKVIKALHISFLFIAYALIVVLCYLPKTDGVVSTGLRKDIHEKLHAQNRQLHRKRHIFFLVKGLVSKIEYLH